MGTLREQMTTDVANVLLNSDELAVSVVYRPRGGASYSVKAVISGDQGYEASENTDSVTADLKVFVSRSTSTDAATQTTIGIPSPQIGDVIAVQYTDDVERHYTFTGEASDVTPESWTLHFTRHVLSSQGRG